MKRVKKISMASRHLMGEHQMYQPLPSSEIESLDPFLLLHHHGPHDFKAYNQGLPFGPHPHRGFETLTLIYEGAVEHADSQGFKSIIKKGGIQWMTAGRGIVHSENLPENMRVHGGELEIIQLWMNLPAKFKMIAPNYQGFQNEEIPFVISSDKKVSTQVISGEHKGIRGIAKSITDLSVFNIIAKLGGQENFEIKVDETVFIYILDGELLINGKLAIGHQFLEFDNSQNTIEVKAQTDSKVLICSGKPLNETVVSQGPFVMNTTTEILQAMRDYQMGKMGIM
jgi:redox-sensitive bicupin YhaK (pirin superfamily)